MPDWIVDVAKLFGPPGVIGAILVVAVVKLYLRNDEIQEKRIADSLAWQTAMRDNTEILRSFAESQKASALTMNAMADSQRATTAQLQATTIEVAKIAVRLKVVE